MSYELISCFDRETRTRVSNDVDDGWPDASSSG